MQVAAASGLVDDLEGRTLRLEDLVAMHTAETGHTGGASGKAALQPAAGKSSSAIAKKLGSYLTPIEFVSGEVLFDFGDVADSIILVLGGSLVSVLDFLSGTEYAFLCCFVPFSHIPCLYCMNSFNWSSHGSHAQGLLV